MGGIAHKVRPTLGKVKKWLLQKEAPDPRRAPRSTHPQAVVHYWDGSAPAGHQLRDISESGAYIYTPERWYIGTIIRIILQGYQTTMPDDCAGAPPTSTCISVRVVRHGSDGVGVEFAFRDQAERLSFAKFLATIPAQPERALSAASESAPRGTTSL